MEAEHIRFYETSEAYFKILVKEGRDYFQEYLDFVKHYVSLPSKILDAGCGLGQSTYFLKEIGYDVIGVDGSRRFIDYAQITFPNLMFKVENLEKLSFSDNSFDAVAIYNTLEHALDVEKVLGEMYRILKPGGFILIHSPNLFSAKHIFDAFFKKDGMTFEGKKSLQQLSKLFFRNIFSIFIRRFKGSHNFKYRNPNYNFSYPDNDATVFLNPVDIQLFLQELGASIISYQQINHLGSKSSIKGLLPTLARDHMGIIRIVAIK